MRLPGHGLDLLKRRNSMKCDQEVKNRAVADAQGDSTDTMILLH